MAITRALPSQAYLRECFDYDPETGILRWRHRPLEHFANEHGQRKTNGRLAGRECGSKRTRGYLGVHFRDHNCLLHRIIWKWMTGDDPEIIDHINHQTDDNRWINLRHATKAQNSRHCHGHKDRKYANAMKGAYRHKAGWMSFIGYRGKQLYLGVFKTEEKAHARYLAEAARLHGDFIGPTVTPQ